MLHPKLYPSNTRIQDITQTLDDYYTALYHQRNNPQQPPKSKLYNQNKHLPITPYEASASSLQTKR